jgi:hypothetical protein
MAKRLKSKLPKVSRLDDGRLAIDVERGTRILYWRGQDNQCFVEIELLPKAPKER